MISLFSKKKPLSNDISDTLDTFRWLSAFIVCVGHSVWVFYSSSLSENNPWGFISGLMSQASVMVFFVLSGFFICQSLCGSIYNGKIDINSYIKKRINRLYPPLLMSLMISLVVFFLAPYFFSTGNREFIDNGFMAREDINDTLGAFIGSAFFLNGFVTSGLKNNPALWSLPYEAWYYVSICFIPFLFKRSVLSLVLLVGGAICFLKPMFAFYGVVWYSGALLAIIYNNSYKINKIILYAIGFVSFCSAIFFGINHGLQSNSIPIYTTLPIIPMYNFSVGIFFAVLLYFILNGSVKIGSFMPSYASFSYTNYVVHMPIMFFIYGTFQLDFISMGKGVLFISSLLLAILIFYISKRLSFIERVRIFRL